MSVRLPEAGQPQDVEEDRSVCTLEAGGRLFGIDTRRIREVLNKRVVQRVPLAPAFLGGIVPYRGEVLTTVSLRAVLGLPAADGGSCVLVLDEDPADPREVDNPGAAVERDEMRREDRRFGLMVDSVGLVMLLPRSTLAPNPSTLDARARTLFAGVFRLPAGGLLVQLHAPALRPADLAASPLFATAAATPNLAGEKPCER